MDAIKMIGIVKCFGSVRANDGIDFVARKCLRHINSPSPSFMRGIRGFHFFPF